MAARTSLRWPILCAVVAVLVYGRALGNGFVLDDVGLIGGLDGGHYRPLTMVSFAINGAVLGSDPFGFHLVNILLHGAVTALAWLALRRAGTEYGTALLGALVFAVLPIHVESVAYVAGRAEILSALFVLGAWIAHRKANEARVEPGWWQLGAAALYLAAVLSNENVALAPVLFLADDVLRGRDGAPRRGRLLVGYAVTFAIVVGLRALSSGVNPSATGAIVPDNPAAAAGVWTRVMTAVWVQLNYALLCLAPIHLASDYSFDAIPVPRSITDPRVMTGFLFLIGLAASAAWGWRHSRPVALAVVIWLLFFLPSSNLIVPSGTIMAERLAYLPSLGLCLAVGHLGASAASPRRRSGGARTRASLVIAFSAVALFGFAMRTTDRIRDWSDDLVLALADVATMPRSVKLQERAGKFLAEAGRMSEAEEHLRRAAELAP
jgi:hypothetical protein